jgi:hypothetical protein
LHFLLLLSCTGIDNVTKFKFFAPFLQSKVRLHRRYNQEACLNLNVTEYNTADNVRDAVYALADLTSSAIRNCLLYLIEFDYRYHTCTGDSFIVAGWDHVGLWPPRTVEEFEAEMDARNVFKYDDLRTNRNESQKAIIKKIAIDLGQPVDSITPEQVQLAFLKVNWDSPDDLIIDKFV